MGEKTVVEPEGDSNEGTAPGFEVPLRMLIPIGIAALMVIVLGLGNSFIVNGILKTTVMGVL